MTRGGRELQLDRRDKFFNDPIFQDILASDDKLLQRKLDVFRKKDASLALLGHEPEAAHNLQVTASNDKFMIQLELPGFLPEDFALKTRDDVIVLEANHRPTAADHGTEFTERHYRKEFQMPEGVHPEKIRSSYSAQGILTIEAPRSVEVPEGAQMQEAMAAKSKAYTTDDGKTNVSEKSQAASQVIAATTESPDGRTKSSMTYSSSSSSSSSVMTSADMGGGMGGMGMMQPPPSMLMGGPGGQPGGMFGQQSMMPPMPDMDDMMRRMMGNMSLMHQPPPNMMGGPNSRMGSNSFSTTSSSTSTQQNISRGSDVFGQFPPMMNMNMPPMPGFPNRDRLDIEELNSPIPPGGDPYNARYTVTSPPPTVASPTPSQHSDYDGLTGRKRSTTTASSSQKATFPSSTSHKVTAASSSDTDSDSGISGVGFGYRSQKDPQADHTVLLKLREGSEYKLVLNMQEFPPENITVKLNDREITVLAHGAISKKGGAATDDFVQRHIVPEGIDLDQLTSTFSADGILVIKAPRIAGSGPSRARRH